MVVLKFASYFKFILNLFLTFRDGNNFVTFSVKSIVNTNVRNESPEKRNTEESEKKSQNMVMVLLSATCVLLLNISPFLIDFFRTTKE